MGETRNIPTLPPDEIVKLAERIVRNEVFTNFHMDRGAGDLLSMVFMPIALGGLADVNPDDVGMIWEAMSEAGPRGVNGYPCFFSCHLLNRPDTKLVLEKVRAMEAALKAAKEAP